MVRLPGVKRRRAAVIYNPSKLDRGKLNQLVEQQADGHGWGSTMWLETAEDDSGAAAARTALDQGAQLILIAGGDGTVRAVAEEVADSGVPVALVPAGTGNVLARNLDLKLTNVEHAIEVAFTGQPRAVDVGEARIHRVNGDVETKAFVVMAGLGLDAEIMVSTSSRGKRLFGWVAYITGALRAVNRAERFRTRIVADRRRGIQTRSHTVLVCNCGALPGNLLLVPDAEVDDGELDVLAISPRRLSDWYAIWQRIVVEHQLTRSKAGQRLVELGGTRRLTTLSHTVGEVVTVSVDRVVPCELDGDVFGEAVGLEARVRRHALQVQVPAGHEG